MEGALTIISPTAVKATRVSSDSLPLSLRPCRRSSEMKKFIFVALLLAGACALSVAQAPNGTIPSTLFASTFIGNGVLQCSCPITDTASFGAFIDALVTRYNVGSSIGTINAYETSNEQDYIGTAAQMAAQIKEYVAHIKAINPSALIVGIGAEG